jgi:hypothetical protein
MMIARRLGILWIWTLATLLLAGPVHAKKVVPATPQIGNFYISPANQFSPGTELTLTLEGTPKGKASARISSINKTVPLTEIDPGVYEGSYTVTSRDRLSAADAVRASLLVGGRTATRNTTLGAIQGQAQAPQAQAAPSPPAGAPAKAGQLAIARFSNTPLSKIEPGADIKFALTGTPGAKAAFSIGDIAKDVPMREVKPGQYEGSYTIRRQDNFPPGVAVTATLEANGQTARMPLNQPLVVAAKPPVIKNVAPREGEVVAGKQAVISGTFDDTGGIGVDTKTVKLTVAGNDVTRSAIVTPQFFSYRTDLKPGPYPVEVTAKDATGAPVHYGWTFTVAAEPPAAAAALPLDVISHAANAQVAAGPVEVRGKTAPDARLDVQVEAVATVAGAFGVSRQIFNQAVQADTAGNFVFTFQSPLPVPGARYEISINAAKNDLRKEMKLVLFQQK